MNLEFDIINTLRLLSVDMVDAANSGHPGMPLGCAPMMYILWCKIMNFKPSDPKWLHRDRFILSNGHGCALLYSMLYLLKYDYSIDDLKKFRQLHSITPGHPEFNTKLGIEISTGPLGQGIANGVGMALASKKQGLTNKIFVMCGDGCLMEGISYEASSLAGHLGLNNLIVLYDDNSITIDGPTSITFTEDIKARFHAQNWNVLEVLDGDNDLQDIEYKLKAATLSEDKPTIICIKTTIGYGSLLAGKSSSHGAPLGAKTANLKEYFGYDKDKTFQIPEQVSNYFEQLILDKKQDYEGSNNQHNQISVKEDNISAIIENLSEIKTETSYATRESSSIVLKRIASQMENILVGSADLAESNKTMVDINFLTKNNFSGKYIHYGIREHAMCSIANGISTYGILPIVSTFLVFITYCLAPIRMAALSNHKVLYIFTHDSVFLGEDGPTHQPIESLTVLRCIPNLLTIRPCDMNEVIGAYKMTLDYNGPIALILSRQKLPNIENSSQDSIQKGAYVVYEPEEIEMIIVATGSEVSLAIEVAKEMKNIRVVSIPCCELYDIQDFTYKEEILPKHVKKMSLEAGGTNGWYKYVDYVYGINTFGESANMKDLKSHFQFDKSSVMKFIQEHIYLNIKLCIFDYDGTLTDGNVTIDANSNIIKQYNTQDGLGLKTLLKHYGIKSCIMTGYSNNTSVEVMSKRLKIDYLYQNIRDKVEITNQIMKEMGINYENIAFMGDDLNDKELLRKVKLSACPKNAVPEIKDICLFKSCNKGGNGAVREFIDYIIKNDKKIIY